MRRSRWRLRRCGDPDAAWPPAARCPHQPAWGRPAHPVAGRRPAGGDGGPDRIRLRRGVDRMTETVDKLGAHEVAAWLRRHPGFLKQFPDLALTLVVPRDDGPTASLASYQLEVLREKNRELARRLADLGATAQINERLAVRTHQLTLALMKQDNAADTLRAMAASLQEDFAGDLVRLVVHTPVAGLEQADWLQVIAADDPQLGPFRDCLKDGEPICGRLQPEKNAVLYGVRSEEVQTTALLPLPGVGLIAVGSHDPNRFYPGMGTLFLRMMGDALATGLKRFAG
ncbi:hypothetical protein G6F57_014730 [Rhizopus arrhizus]|nr:hypothetical protein G6F57_014730 [Rhizopus arrhizus]